MPFVPVPNVVKIVLEATDNGGNQAVNVIHANEPTGTSDINVLDTMLDVVEAWLSSDWSGVVASTWSATRLTALDLTSENSVYADRTISVAGTALAAAAPSEVTICMSLRTGYAGRSNRGRLYHIGLDDAAFTGDYMSPTNIASLINTYEQLRSGFLAEGFKWVVVSYTEDGVAKNPGTFKEITSIVITDPIVDSMRSRKPRP